MLLRISRPRHLWPTIGGFIVCFSILLLFPTFLLYGDDDDNFLFPFSNTFDPCSICPV